MEIREKVLPIEGTSRLLARQDGRLGSILAESGKFGEGDIERVLELQHADGLRFGEAALRLGLVTADEVRSAVAKQFGFPHLLAGSRGTSDELVVAFQPFHPRTEELRAIRTQLLIRWSKASVERRMLAVVSPGPGEGRSYVAANLAVLFAQLGQRTLLIDADLRKPRQHRIFRVGDRIGLSSILAGRADSNAVAAVSDFGPLSLLPAGACPPNPQELLLRPAFALLLRELGARFDVILFDTPPGHLYADAQSLAFRAGSAMVLARKDHTRLDDTASVVRQLGDTGVRVVGTVLNAF